MLRALRSQALSALDALERRVNEWRARRRWRQLVSAGMRIGQHVELPSSTWIDVAHCYLISIGDRCRFGPYCLILAHDAQMDEFLDAGRLGRVVIGAGCHIGARCVILCNVVIGPGSIIEAGSVVATSLPGGSYCAGSPAQVVSTVADFAARIKHETADRPAYTRDDLTAAARDPAVRARLLAELASGPALARSSTGTGRAG
jgi:maltose O-acetyltransferase